MKQDDVAHVVREASYELHRKGAARWDGYIVNPMAVLHALREHRPDVVRHIRRYYRGDPYQQLKVWVPRQ